METMPSWNLGGGLAFNLSPVITANLNVSWFGLEPSEFRDSTKIKHGGSGFSQPQKTK
jgi:hypothetical protein